MKVWPLVTTVVGGASLPTATVCPPMTTLVAFSTMGTPAAVTVVADAALPLPPLLVATGADGDAVVENGFATGKVGNIGNGMAVKATVCFALTLLL